MIPMMMTLTDDYDDEYNDDYDDDDDYYDAAVAANDNAKKTKFKQIRNVSIRHGCSR